MNYVNCRQFAYSKDKTCLDLRDSWYAG